MFVHYGETLRRLRESAHIGRAVLAKQAGVSSNDLGSIEKCASRPPLEVLRPICTKLQVAVEDLDVMAGTLPRGLTPGSNGNGAHAPTSSKKVSKPILKTSLGALHHSDCMEVMGTLTDGSVDLVFADPPFNLDKDYGVSVNDSLSEQRYLSWCVEWMSEVVRVLKPGGAFFLYNLPKWNVRLAAWLYQHLEFKHWIAVDIKFSLPISGRLYPSHYSLLYFTKGPRPNRFAPPRIPIETCRHCGGELRDYGGYKDRMNPAGVNISDVWTDLSPVRHSRFKRRKANELPLKMLDRVLDIASAEGDLVFDPFGGSGTTYVAAELKKRRWIGSEIGDCQPIIDRFGEIERERNLLQEIRAKVNVLSWPSSRKPTNWTGPGPWPTAPPCARFLGGPNGSKPYGQEEIHQAFLSMACSLICFNFL